MADNPVPVADPLITAEELKKVKESFSSLDFDRKDPMTLKEFAEIVRHVVKLSKDIGSPERAAQAAQALAELHQ